jgi:hypothetical protein
MFSWQELFSFSLWWWLTESKVMNSVFCLFVNSIMMSQIEVVYEASFPATITLSWEKDVPGDFKSPKSQQISLTLASLRLKYSMVRNADPGGRAV